MFDRLRWLLEVCRAVSTGLFSDGRFRVPIGCWTRFAVCERFMELSVVDGRVGVATKRFSDWGGRCVVTGVPVEREFSLGSIVIYRNYEIIH